MRCNAKPKSEAHIITKTCFITMPFKPKWWQLPLSHITEILIEKTSSPINPYLEVVLSKGRLRLNTPEATYSYGDLYQNFYRTFLYLRIEQYRLHHALLLGFGLGSIPTMLYDCFEQKTLRYTAVEIDAEIIRLAHHYLPDYLLRHITCICADALICLPQHRPEKLYDLIAFDIFIDQKTPTPFWQADFLTQLKSLLSPSGILIFNTLAITPQQEQQSKLFFAHTFKPLFPSASLINTNGNLVYVYAQKK